MYTLITHVARFLSVSRPGGSPAELPHQLLESAGARAGHDLQQARELRQAACAYLRVVR